jgi:hypothetical protein
VVGGERWAVQLEFVPGEGTRLYELEPMNARSSSAEKLDFCYSVAPPDLAAFRQEIAPPRNEIVSQQKIQRFEFVRPKAPKTDEEFGFCGAVQPAIEKHPSVVYSTATLHVQTGLRYLRSEGQYEIYALPDSHPGHEHFQGCSGAPVLSRDLTPRALVCSGDSERNEIRAVSLGLFFEALEAVESHEAGGT